jgi:hypothetical protein
MKSSIDPVADERLGRVAVRHDQKRFNFRRFDPKATRQNLGVVPVHEFERYESSQQSRRIKLADDGLNISETARVGMHGRDVAIACGSEGDEAEVDQVPRNGYKISLWRVDTLERIGHKKTTKPNSPTKIHPIVRYRRTAPTMRCNVTFPGPNTARATTVLSVRPAINQAVASR